MVYLESTIGVVSGKMNEYLDIVSKELMPIYARVGIKMIGSWRTIAGSNNNEVVILFQFDSLAQMEKQFAARTADKDFQKLFPRYQAVTTGNAARILQPNSYSTIK
jgi:hypothetical protein